MANLISIKIYSNRIEAESDKSLLESYNIKSIVSADDCGGMRPNLAFTSGVKLLIDEKNQKKASEILKLETK